MHTLLAIVSRVSCHWVGRVSIDLGLCTIQTNDRFPGVNFNPWFVIRIALLFRIRRG